MNEQLLALYQYAIEFAYETTGKEDSDKPHFQAIVAGKFAELIIKECGKILVENTPEMKLVEDWDKGYDRAMNDCIHLIYEHFGVEE